MLWMCCCMDVYPPRYGCSCQPSFWNFVRNLGYSQAISDDEMRWLRLHTQPIFISHQCYIYKRCLTTFICCGCAYGCVPTTLLLEFCQKSGLLPGNKWWWNEVLEAAHPTHIHLTSMLYIKSVWQPLHAVDVHMDVSPPRYGCSCRPTFWNFVRNLGYSQAISDVEMQCLRLHTQPISSHINCIYLKGVWQPLHAVDVHMDVFPPRYGCSCRPSILEFC